ncbi:MAG: hypothetical protein HY761_07175 [Candidatus Omnitrophica bacterium]|nr:hypothetical protein [Candidatus Omnitrophota bacterium]
MQKDPIVEEVRRIRHEIEHECQEDPNKLFEYFQDSQRNLGDRLVCREPKILELSLQSQKAA